MENHLYTSRSQYHQSSFDRTILANKVKYCIELWVESRLLIVSDTMKLINAWQNYDKRDTYGMFYYYWFCENSDWRNMVLFELEVVLKKRSFPKPLLVPLSYVFPPLTYLRERVDQMISNRINCLADNVQSAMEIVDIWKGKNLNDDSVLMELTTLFSEGSTWSIDQYESGKPQEWMKSQNVSSPEELEKLITNTSYYVDKKTEEANVDELFLRYTTEMTKKNERLRSYFHVENHERLKKERQTVTVVHKLLGYQKFLRLPNGRVVFIGNPMPAPPVDIPAEMLSPVPMVASPYLQGGTSVLPLFSLPMLSTNAMTPLPFLPRQTTHQHSPVTRNPEHLPPTTSGRRAFADESPADTHQSGMREAQEASSILSVDVGEQYQEENQEDELEEDLEENLEDDITVREEGPSQETDLVPIEEALVAREPQQTPATSQSEFDKDLYQYHDAVRVKELLSLNDDSWQTTKPPKTSLDVKRVQEAIVINGIMEIPMVKKELEEEKEENEPSTSAQQKKKNKNKKRKNKKGQKKVATPISKAEVAKKAQEDEITIYRAMAFKIGELQEKIKELEVKTRQERDVQLAQFKERNQISVDEARVLGFRFMIKRSDEIMAMPQKDIRVLQAYRLTDLMKNDHHLWNVMFLREIENTAAFKGYEQMFMEELMEEERKNSQGPSSQGTSSRK